MKKITTIIIAAFSVLLNESANAQDFHLSQFDLMPVYYNPANTGMYPGIKKLDYRFAGDIRSQWQKLKGKPYSAASTSFDMPYKQFGFGAILTNHIAGASNFDSFQMMLSGAYRITDEKSPNHFLSAGLQLGFYQKKFSQRDLLFENQYTTQYGLDPTLPNGELLPDLSIIRFDANMGVFYKYMSPGKKYNPSLGLSVFHINRPNESFTGEEARLPMRFNGIFSCEVNFDANWSVTPNVLYMYQGKAQEINAGLLAGYKINQTKYQLIAGGAYRVKDSIVIQTGIKHGNTMFRISYDIVTSPLKQFSGARGGFELGFIYAAG
jgi:type IX secretion system PorP/SprF family membrane protein